MKSIKNIGKPKISRFKQMGISQSIIQDIIKRMKTESIVTCIKKWKYFQIMLKKINRTIIP